MKVRLSRVAVLLALFAAAPTARAAAVPVEVKLTGVRCVQNYMLDVKAEDQIYGVVTGVAKGEPVNVRLPKEGTIPAAPKKQPITDKEPVELWKGELAEGEFALLTYTLFHGADAEKPGDAAAVQALVDATAAAAKTAAGDKKTLTAADAKTVSEAALKATAEAVGKATHKDSGTLGRAKGTDHLGGQFTVLVWNDGGKIVKRLDPVGLVFGEHYGTDVKIYSKLKNTRANVLVADEGGSFFPQQLTPLSEDKGTVRVKMLETEFEKNAKTGRLIRNTADYVVELQVLAADKPVTWTLGGEVPGETPIHTYWGWAE